MSDNAETNRYDLMIALVNQLKPVNTMGAEVVSQIYSRLLTAVKTGQ